MRRRFQLIILVFIAMTPPCGIAASPATGSAMMSDSEITVSSVPDLVAALQDSQSRMVTIDHSLHDVPSLAMRPGQQLRGSGGAITLTFAASQEGLKLSADNRVSNVQLVVATNKRAIFNDTAVGDLGRIELQHITTVGRVQILARDQIRGGHVEVGDLNVIAADATGERDRPHGFGVYALQGAFTLWNQQPDAAAVVTANLVGISVGRIGKPVLGSGVFVCGTGDNGGRVQVQRLETGPVYSDGRIAPGTHDQITGGVGVWSGASADVVRCRGPVVTYGTNDMALDNWGTVERWTADEPIITQGPSGIGFVNFGAIGELSLNAPIETFGPGARGFNVYAGTVKLAEFDRIVTHGDGAVGVQISQPIGRLIVSRGIETFGGAGPSLVKGVLTNLSAIALSVQSGGIIRRVNIAGGLKTNGKDVSPLELHGVIESLAITDRIAAAGGR